MGWGSDQYGQATALPEGRFVAVAAGFDFSVALRDDGTLVAWGFDFDGQVSDVPGGSDFVAISAGYWHAMALRSDGSIVVWGNDDLGQVSDAPASSDFVAVSAGWHYNLALRADGSLVSWGADDFGEVGATPDGNDFVAISAGAFHGVAIWSVPDQTPPTITLSLPADGAVFLLGQHVAAAYACQDDEGGSGLAACIGTLPNGAALPTGSVGARSFTVEAEDNAGNRASLTHSYSVAYDFSGFQAPLRPGTIPSIKAGRIIPLQWRLLDGLGQPVTALAGVAVSVTDRECELGSTPDLPEESATGRSGLQNLGDGWYQYNWKTPSNYAGSCKTLHLDLGEGGTRTAAVQFTK